jgi:hypothetical protein
MQLPRCGQAIWEGNVEPNGLYDLGRDMLVGPKVSGKARDKPMLISVKKEAPLLGHYILFGESAPH